MIRSVEGHAWSSVHQLTLALRDAVYCAPILAARQMAPFLKCSFAACRMTPTVQLQSESPADPKV